MKPARRLAPPPRPDGSVAVPFVVMLPVMLGFMGLAIDLAVLYARNAELQHVADAVAVAAAHELNGTAAGVAKARSKASAIALANYFDFSTEMFTADSWSSGTLYLSTAASGAEWKAADSVTDDATAAELLYAKVDTAALSSANVNPGLVDTSFMRAVGDHAGSVTAAPVAIAGRASMQVTPLAFCALSTTKFQRRPLPSGTELVELGYRRGVTYNLLDLNPSGPAPQNFVVNPVDPGGSASVAAHFGDSWVKPFICSGTIGYGKLRTNGTVNIQPLAGRDVHNWLNSRFGDYPAGDGCSSRDGAPPDKNVKQFLAASSWMATALGPSARATYTIAGNTRVTIADVTVGPLTGVDPVTAGGFGPLWVYNKPVKYVAGSATGAAVPNPVFFSTTDWSTLYPVSSGSAPSASSYPNTPYLAQSVSPSAGVSYAERRVLNLPLLDCSGGTPGASATVLGVGRFFMTSRATAAALYAEFAGLATDDKLATLVALHQ
jgi:Flp pilus assembly protein TadG